MKDLTYYFTDTSKSSESTDKDRTEVKLERAKIIQECDTKTEVKSNFVKKRERVKIKITNRNTDDVACKILKNNVDLIDKTPSPRFSDQKDRYVENNDILKTKRSPYKFPKKDLFSTQSHFNEHQQSQKAIESSNSENDCDITILSDSRNIFNKCSENENNDFDEEILESKVKKNKNKTKLLSLANKKGLAKRKIIEEEESEKIENRLKERKKMFTTESKNVFLNNGNLINNNQKKPSCSLLNYFSKATPEQLEKERIAMSKVVVKVDVHEPRESLTPKSISLPTIKPTKENKNKSDAKELLNKADDIEFVSSENLSPLLISIPSPKTLQKSNKPKWSLKVKLNSCDDDSTLPKLDDSIENEIFTPRSKFKHQKEYSKTGNDYAKKKEKLNELVAEDKDEKIKKYKKKLKLNKSKSEYECPDLIKSEITEKNTSKQGDKHLLKNNTNSEQKKHTTIPEEDKDNCLILEDNALKRKPVEKIAPLFMKRRKCDPVDLTTRRQLSSEVINVNDISEPSKSNQNSGPIILSFPRISHVTQLNHETIPKECDLKSSFSMKVQKKSYETIFDMTQLRHLNESSITKKSNTTVVEVIKANVEDSLKEIESRCSDARLIWEKVSAIVETKHEDKKTPKRGRSKKKMPDKKAVEEGKKETDSQSQVWTCKYRPMNSQVMIGNEEAVKKLRNWLSAWKRPTVAKDESSGDEFYSSDCSRTSGIEKNQVAVLLGPHGCGKTASVYTVAEELGYSVLEVNASSRRPGKKIFKDLEEATKSHRIRNTNMESFGFGLGQKLEQKKIPENSLILLDDVDLVFEEDEGFSSATFQLASNTRRPIVMTCKAVFPCLYKLAPQQMRIHYQAVTGKRASAFLELISLAETGCKLTPSCAANLLETGDLRKALLQLQYLLLSGREPSLLQLGTSRASLWRDTQNGLYKPVVKRSKSQKKKQKQDETAPFTKPDNDLLHNLAISLDNVCLISRLYGIQDIALDSLDSKPEASLSLIEDYRSYSSLNDTGTAIADWLVQKTLQKSNSFESKEIMNFSHLLIKKSVSEGVNLALSQSTALTVDRRAISTDYLACLRNICRAEEIRSTNNSKRGNRFYHYLQGIITVKPHIFTAASQMLQDKSKIKDIS